MSFRRHCFYLIAILPWVFGAMLVAFGMQVMAVETVVDKQGKATLRDETGKEVVLRLRQHPLSHTVIDLVDAGPEYIVTVNADRTVVFNGVSMVKTRGKASHTLTEKQYREMVLKLKGFLEEKAENPPGGLSYAKLSVSIDGVVREILFDGSNARRYSKLRNTLEEYLRTMQYRCPVKRSPRWPENFDVCKSVFEFETLFSQRSEDAKSR